ncbi:MAG: undecaprenyldiphospho-muramoylpentapeptide beta-N-acetylglucosaminyltransferase [Ferruginibacter sp.]
MNAQRFIIAGGGTGGHIFPAIAIANAIKDISPGSDILFVGAKGKMEMEKVPQAGYNIEGLTIAGFNRSSLIKNIMLPFKLVYSFIQVTRLFKRFQPTAVIGVGGYSSFPVLRFAQAKGIPTFIHESNSFAGKSNILLSKKASLVFTAGNGMEKFFPVNKIVVTGNPVRKSIRLNDVRCEEALTFFGLTPGKKTILSVGGSLGAKSINEAIANSIDAFEKNDLQLIWQTGKPFQERAENIAKGRRGILVSNFINKMEYAYAAADVVISRSGAMAISELCVVKKPVVFVPYPFAAEDHQTANAERLVNKEAAIMIKDSEAPDKLVEKVIALAKDEHKQDVLKQNISSFSVTDADVKIVAHIFSYLHK